MICINKSETSGINFIKDLRAAFAGADPKSAKKTDNLTVFFALSESARAQAARRTLMKLIPARRWTVLLPAHFSQKTKGSFKC